MSGGSHNHLGRGFHDMRDVLSQYGDLPGMASRLDEMGYTDVSRATLDLYERLTAAPDAFLPLCRVWLSVDRFDSCDDTEEDVTSAVGEWRNALEQADGENA